jgi:DNA adenine methylase
VFKGSSSKIDIMTKKNVQPYFPGFESFTPPTAKVFNVAAVPHRSPFRYPGGKTWLVPYTRRWLKSLSTRPAEFAEVFAGGAIVGLSAIFDNMVDHLTLVERDDDVAAVWSVIFCGQAKELAELIVSFEMTRENVEAVLAKPFTSTLEHAFTTILRNRVLHSGILSPGSSFMKHGENGKGLKSRWYASTLKRRILDLHEVRDRITFIQGDGIQYMRKNARRKKVAFFVDPPYTVAGRRLYVHSEVNHAEILYVAATVRGPLLATYDDAEEIRTLATKSRLTFKTIPMQNKRHVIQQELLIGKDFTWLN